MKMLSGKKSALIAALTVSVTVVAATPASAAWQILGSWTNVKQANTNWCWAADDDAILAHYGYTSPTQADIVNYVFNTTTAPNNPASDSQTQNALYHYGVSTNAFSAPLGFLEIKAQISGDETINGNKPILVHWNWTNQSVGHAVVAIGWSTENATNQVRYMDPADGNAYWMPSQDFISDGKHTWTSGLKDAWAYK
ncbi:MAG: papain-like cysteine protease family protein [Tumebacillaceae bacterium]